MFKKFTTLIVFTTLALAQGAVPYLKPAPKAVAPTEVTYWLYTKSSQTTPIELFNGFLNNAQIDFTKKTKFIVHGFNEDMNDFMNFLDNYMLAWDFNVILVNWPGKAGTYNNNVDKVVDVGNILGSFMEFYVSAGALYADLHCIGYDLGSHICGLSGKYILTLGVRNGIGRITGLEPNSDGFSITDATTRLDSGDAEFVDVIHTCSDKISFSDGLGDVDFYPNAGIDPQPDCGAIGSSCSHERVTDLFAESILTGGFRAYICTSYEAWDLGSCDLNPWESMGERCATDAVTGNYYLDTYGKSPYAIG